MASPSTPLVPELPDIVWTLGLVAVLLLALTALVSIFRAGMTSYLRGLWIIAVILFPLLGPAIWFLVGRKPGKSRAA